MRMKSPEPKYNLGISENRLIISLGPKAKEKQKFKVFHSKFQYKGPFKYYQVF